MLLKSLFSTLCLPTGIIPQDHLYYSPLPHLLEPRHCQLENEVKMLFHLGLENSHTAVSIDTDLFHILINARTYDHIYSLFKKQLIIDDKSMYEISYKQL